MGELNHVECFFECNQDNYIIYIEAFCSLVMDLFDVDIKQEMIIKWKFDDIDFNYISDCERFEFSTNNLTVGVLPVLLIYKSSEHYIMNCCVCLNTYDVSEYVRDLFRSIVAV